FQSGDVDFLVATDAVGMGLNLDVDHVAFSAVRKFDGYNHRSLTPGELGQVAGRAGRHLSDGTFGVTGDAEPLEADLIERLESHMFDPLKTLQWRNNDLNFATIDALRDSLRELPKHHRLMRARMADDVEALENLTNDRDVMEKATNRAAVTRLWDVCQIPDYRKISSQNHAELVGTVYNYLMSEAGRIDDDWFAKQVEFSDRVDGDIDTLSNRLAHIRTWTFVANRPDWLRDPEYWQGRAREIEDNLSDALHERLTQRFVDKRTSALMKGLKDKQNLNAEISEDGEVKVEDHFVGRLQGFRFIPDTHSDSIHGKATRHAAAQVLSRELSMRVRRVTAAKNDAFKLGRNARILWRGDEIAQLSPEEDPLKPQVTLIADEHLQGADREKVLERAKRWLVEEVAERLKPLVDMTAADDIAGLAKGIAFRLVENFGVLRREAAAAEIKALDQTARSQLRKYGLRFGAFNVFFPLLLKPAAADLLLTLWCLKFAGEHGLDPENLPEPPRAGLTSVPIDPELPEIFYKVYGFHVCGPRAVRIDILERLADQIRPLLGWRASEAQPEPPRGATGDGAFIVTPEMMSILGCSSEELGDVLRTLGFRSERRPNEAAKPEESTAESTDSAKPDQPQSGSSAGGTAEAEAVGPQSESTTSDAAEAPATASEASPDTESSEVPAAQGEADAQAQPASDDGVPDDSGVVAAATADETTSDLQETSGQDDVAASADDGLGATEAGAEDAQSEPATADTAHEAGEVSAPAAADSADSAAAEAAASEPEFIEVWRPKRRNEGQRRGRRSSGPRRRQAGDAAGDARSDNQAAAGAGNKPDSTGTSGTSAHERHGEKKAEGGRRDNRKDKRRRNSGRDGRREDRGKPAVHTSAPKRSAGAVDPDSPFAALGALRQAMDDNDRGSQSS
ncbi:MAG: helicase-related protein, partial [Hyphomicrobiaceae bacterium]